jgi:hypothetical protein
MVMLAIFSILFCLAILLLLISLVNPSIGLFWLRKGKTRVRALLIYGIIVAFSVVGFVWVISTFRWAIQEHQEEEMYAADSLTSVPDSSSSDTASYHNNSR